MKDKLLKLFKECKYNSPDRLADYLIENGVIIPPCKVGDDIYWIDSGTNAIVREKSAIKAVCYFGEGKFEVICKGEKEPEAIGTKWCILTREEAEKKLQEDKEGQEQ